MDLDGLLRAMVKHGGSDLFVTSGAPPSLKVNGEIIALSRKGLSSRAAAELVLDTMDARQRKEFVSTKECNFALTQAGVGRFRVNVFRQRNQVGMVIRRIEENIPELDQLGLPEVIKSLAMVKRGLVIVVGGTGTGKSTTLAAMIGHRNRHSHGHIVSIEDPIEFIHTHHGCIVTQREVGIDTDSFDAALKNTLRQAPDVILIGEIRTRETMEYALAFAETGHLVLATLHANNANQALDRILHFFPADRHGQVWMDLSLNLKGVVAQQLVKTIEGDGRKAVIEVMLNTPLVADRIREGDAHLIKDIMEKSRELGMQTFDQALFALYKQGEISYENALRHADSANNLRLMIKLDKGGDEGERFETTTANLTIDQDIAP